MRWGWGIWDRFPLKGCGRGDIGKGLKGAEINVGMASGVGGGSREWEWKIVRKEGVQGGIASMGNRNEG